MSDIRRFLLVLAVAAATTTVAQEPRVQDPMRPPAPPRSEGAAGSPVAGLSLTAVLVSASRRIAIVNGQIYREGDSVNGEEIVAIEPGSILIRRGGTDVRVRVRNHAAVTTRNDGEHGQ